MMYYELTFMSLNIVKQISVSFSYWIFIASSNSVVT